MLIFMISFSFTTKGQESEKSNAITTSLIIKGTIKNYDEVVKLANSKSYIQLVPIVNGIIWTAHQFTEGSISSVYYDSKLNKLPIPKQSTFSYKCDSIAAGLYFLAIQGLKINWMSSEEGPMLLTDQGNLYTITIPSDVKPIIEINTGSLTVRIKR
jgi:hypothetical protein